MYLLIVFVFNAGWRYEFSIRTLIGEDQSEPVTLQLWTLVSKLARNFVYCNIDVVKTFLNVARIALCD